ncbi:MAG: 3',5'-cyclic AMP phosphodiesterase CpdA [Chlamydiales bacterium]|jgi:3',5'-cyclic AMP phosphodiesterase CpdA
MLSVVLLFAFLVPQTTTEQLPQLETLPGYGQEDFEAFSFVQIGDPQIGFGGAYPAARRFERLAAEVDSAGMPFGIVVGDLVQDRTGREYRLLRGSLDAFSLPLAFVPGNHDVLDLPTLETYRADFGRDYYSFIYNGCGFIGFNSELLEGSVEGGISTEESAAQWEWFDKELVALKACGLRHTFLFLHRPPPLGSGDDLDPVIQRVREHGIQHILAGHWHTTEEVTAADGAFTIFTVGGTARVFDDRGYGYRIFDVTNEGVDQRYIEFDRPSDHWLVRYGWSPRILDPSLPHWLLTLTFLVAAAFARRAHRRVRAHADPDPEAEADGSLLWLLLSLGYVTLAVSQQLDLDEILQAIGRRGLESLHGYGDRRVLQVAILGAGLFLGVIALWLARRQLRHTNGRAWIALLGFAIPATSFLLHALSLHQADALLYAFGRAGLYTVEATGAAITVYGARLDLAPI